MGEGIFAGGRQLETVRLEAAGGGKIGSMLYTGKIQKMETKGEEEIKEIREKN